jgi:hypothetical protein
MTQLMLPVSVIRRGDSVSAEIDHRASTAIAIR